jgi:hypothetical protein
MVTAAYADSWDVTQSVTVANDTTLSQAGGSNSTQTMNAVNLGSASTVSGSQNVNTDGHTLNLSQSGDSNKQAANLITAGTIAPTTQQNVSAGSVSLQSNGSNNLQALNMAIATNTGGLTQTVTLSRNTAFTVSGSGNVQAGNYLNTDNITGNISQAFDTPNITYTDTGTTNLQAGNIIIRKTGGGFTGTVTQRFNTSGPVTITGGSGAYGSTKAANYFAFKS